MCACATAGTVFSPTQTRLLPLLLKIIERDACQIDGRHGACLWRVHISARMQLLAPNCTLRVLTRDRVFRPKCEWQCTDLCDRAHSYLNCFPIMRSMPVLTCTVDCAHNSFGARSCARWAPHYYEIAGVCVCLCALLVAREKIKRNGLIVTGRTHASWSVCEI